MHRPQSFGLRAPRRAWLAVAASAALVAALTLDAGLAGAAGPNALDRFTRIDVGTLRGITPQGLDRTPATYVLELAADPVTVASNQAGNHLSKAQKAALQAQLKAAQAPVIKAANAAGARVLGSYQLVYDGVKVRATSAQLGKLLAVPGVVAAHRITPIAMDNIHGVPLVGAPQVWDGLDGLQGEGIKVGIIDTGIDYTHADFGGPGTVDAYQAALATDTAPADPSLFGPSAPKVKGGTDLVGDTYNADPTSASYQPDPHPDPNPLDCAGHGTHVAGTAAGFGVLGDGSTYHGPYNATTVSGNQWIVGPGVAPLADLYAIRVFGCAGSTDVVTDALEWAAQNGMDVINMSLGAPFGSADDPDAVASDNLAKAGIIVVASAGNSGPNPYITGSPSTGTRTISVAANDPTQSFPGVIIDLATGPDVTAIDANGTPVNGLSAPIRVLYSGTPHDAAHISLGCDPNEYTAAGVTGDIVVVRRGTCARVARAIFGQEAGAAAVIMVNSSNSLPPFEGPITSNPDTGQQYTVTIPFLGVKLSDGAALVANDGTTANLSDTTLTNPGYLATASFSSGGPRLGDSWLKPDVTAPGVSIISAGMGTGNGIAILSGTSMAAPHTTGVAALVRQAHPGWTVEQWKAAIVNTASTSLVSDYRTRVDGSGFIQAPPAVATRVVATGDAGTSTLNFGFAEYLGSYSKAKQVHLTNTGAAAVTFDVSTTSNAGAPHSVGLSSSVVTVPAHGSVSVSVTLNVPVGTSPTSAAFGDVSGLVRFAPRSGGNGGVALDVPFYLVPLADSKIRTSVNVNQLNRTGSTIATISNDGAITGAADWYAWGISDALDTNGGMADIQAVGVQSFPNDGVLAIALSTYGRNSNWAANEFDVYVDVNGDDTADYVVVSADAGALTTGSNDGRTAVAVFDLRTGHGSIDFLADAPFNGTTEVLPVLFSQLCATGSPCLTTGDGRITYDAVGFGRDGTKDTPDAEASFNVSSPAISTGMFDSVAPGGTASETVAINWAERAHTPFLGLMIVSHDNAATSEAQLISVP
jgi:minor extracellular serine protease Vpr